MEFKNKVKQPAREEILNNYIKKANEKSKDLSKEEKEKRDIFLEEYGGEI